MTELRSAMIDEIAEAPAVVARLETQLGRPLGDLLTQLHRRKPKLVVTCARGSSAHAATFAKHLIERYLGLPVAEAAPSISSVYGQRLDVRNQLLLAVSQSGCSDDLIAFANDARDAGALTVAITNSPISPLAAACEMVVPLAAGAERSVAATKTFMATAAALMRLVGTWAENSDLLEGVNRLPSRLGRATTLDWTRARDALARTSHLAVLGRGPTLAIAREAALKLKETCRLHAEAYSGAEFQHGPMALVRPHYPVLVFTPADEAAPAMHRLCRDLASREASLLVADAVPSGGTHLSSLPAEQPEADALCLLQSFYVMAAALAVQLGVDADNPPHLTKITRTT